MDVAGYLIEVPARRFASLNRKLAAALTHAQGCPLLPVSSGWALINSSNFRDARSALGADGCRRLFERHGVGRTEALDEARFIALLQSRDPRDLPERVVDAPAPVDSTDGEEKLDWHLVETRIDRAWRLFGGRDEIDWSGIRIGHIDTGWTFHRALGFSRGRENSAWVDTAHDRNCFSRDFEPIGDLPPARPFPASRDSAQDPLSGANGGHGTKTLSVLSACDASAAARRGAAPEGSRFSGFFGAAPRVPVVPVRVNDTVWLDLELAHGLPEAIHHLVATAECRVVSLSMGSPSFFAGPRRMPAELEEAIDFAYARGTIVVCAAGNHIPNERVVFPARCPRTIAAGGSTLGGAPWSGSSYGAEVDVCAPAWPVRHAVTLRNGRSIYEYGDGTSYATPQVAGAAALWLAYHRDAIAHAYHEPWQVVAAFASLLRASARVPAGWRTHLYGAGILDAERLLALPLPPANEVVKDTEPF